MSRIYFHCKEGEDAELAGSERAYAGVLCGDLLSASLGPIFDFADRPSWIRRYIPKDDYLHKMPITTFEQSLRTWLSVGFYDFEINGEKESVFRMALNTAYLMGNDAIRLLARLHGQCEIHCWVAEENRAWLADIIDVGWFEQRILRNNMGWQKVMRLLRDKSIPGPIVTSYSVCDSFPNGYVAEEGGVYTYPLLDDGEKDYDAWYELPREQRWDLAMAGLRATPLLELRPDTWEAYKFGRGITGFDLVAAAHDEED